MSDPDHYRQKCEIEGEISVLMVGFQSPGIELPWHRSALSECSCLFIWGLRHFQHCIGHIMTGGFVGRGNQYIQMVKVLYCKLSCHRYQLFHIGFGVSDTTVSKEYSLGLHDQQYYTHD